MRTARPLYDRIDEKLVPVGDCLLWTGRTEGRSYPVIKLDGKRVPIRPVQWVRHRGPLPASRLVNKPQIEMTCGNPACLNPRHMMVRTDAERELLQARKEVFARNRYRAERDPKYRYLLAPGVIDRMARRLVAEREPVVTTPGMQAEVQVIMESVRRRVG